MAYPTLLAMAVLAMVMFGAQARSLQSENDDVLAALKEGKAKWIALRDQWGLTDSYQFRLFRPCSCSSAGFSLDCFLGDHGPFYITVKDGDVTEALLMWNDTPLNATKFKTIEEAFYSMKDMLEDGVSVASGWRFDDVQGVPDEVLVFPAEKEYGTRITVRMPKEFHLQRLEASKKAFAALGLISYSFTFQGICFGCAPAKTMVVKKGKGVKGSMTMEDVFALMETVILKEPLFLDVFYFPSGLPQGMDVDLENAVVEGDTDDTFRISDFEAAK